MAKAAAIIAHEKLRAPLNIRASRAEGSLAGRRALPQGAN
jgi:hypothetical protein